MDNERNIGALSGMVLVFGGVYSNLQALTELKAIAAKEGIPPSNIICTGDVVGYCAQPEESLRMIRDWGIYTIAGNVELQIRNGQEDCGCNFDEGTRCDLLSQQWYPFAYRSISDEMKEWLDSMPEYLRFTYAGKEGFVLHGGYPDTSQFIFRSTNWKVKQDLLKATHSDLILAGHCGLPFHCSEDETCWLNAGVIGMPANDGTPRVWYMLMDDQNGLSFEHRPFHYDHNTAARLMREGGLPTSYARTLSTGIWDNCEVLPEKEAREQGKKIG